MIAIIFITAWIACGIVSGLAFYCYFQREYLLFAEEHRKEDMADAIKWSLWGPIALVAAICTKSFKHGINPFKKS